MLDFFNKDPTNALKILSKEGETSGLLPIVGTLSNLNETMGFLKELAEQDTIKRLERRLLRDYFGKIFLSPDKNGQDLLERIGNIKDALPFLEVLATCHPDLLGEILSHKGKDGRTPLERVNVLEGIFPIDSSTFQAIISVLKVLANQSSQSLVNCISAQKSIRDLLFHKLYRPVNFKQEYIGHGHRSGLWHQQYARDKQLKEVLPIFDVLIKRDPEMFFTMLTENGIKTHEIFWVADAVLESLAKTDFPQFKKTISLLGENGLPLLGKLGILKDIIPFLNKYGSEHSKEVKYPQLKEFDEILPLLEVIAKESCSLAINILSDIAPPDTKIEKLVPLMSALIYNSESSFAFFNDKSFFNRISPADWQELGSVRPIKLIVPILKFLARANKDELLKVIFEAKGSDKSAWFKIERKWVTLITTN